MVWIDTGGRLREGPVPASETESLWGVGFYHRTSRDAFIALRLEHTAEGFSGPSHGGAPTLHYDGHGQLWSRYPAERTEMRGGTAITQKNAYLMTAYPDDGAAEMIQSVRHRLLHPPEISEASEGSWKTVSELPEGAGGTALARTGETAATAGQKSAIWNTLRAVKDEQLYNIKSSIVDLGYVYDVRQRAGTVYVVVTMPHRGRPVYQFLETQGGGRVEEGIRERLLELPGISKVVVEMTWNPPWSEARLSASAREELGLVS